MYILYFFKQPANQTDLDSQYVFERDTGQMVIAPKEEGINKVEHLEEMGQDIMMNANVSDVDVNFSNEVRTEHNQEVKSIIPLLCFTMLFMEVRFSDRNLDTTTKCEV